jgi:putative ABC transport system permease protein
VNWWRRLRHRDRLERELDAELRYHFDREVDDYVRMGLSVEEARRRARLDFGGDDQLKESCRDARGTRWAHDLSQDLRFAARLLVKDRWFALPAAIALAIGIGMNGAMFTIVNAMVRGLPIERPDRLLSLHARDGAGRWRGNGVSHLDFHDFQAGARTFSGLAAVSQSSVTLGDGGGAAERVSAAYVSANTFQLLGATPSVGRDFDAADDRSGAPAVVILGGRIWKTRYSADRAIIGRTVRINGEPSTVVGVMPDGFRFPVVSDIWQPLARMPGILDQSRDTRTLQVFGRLADRSTRAQAQADVEAIAARLSRAYPAANANTSVVVAPFPGSFAPAAILVVLMIAVGLVLMVGCINVASLLLARSVGRSRELTIRVSLGATRWRIVRQLLAESSVLVLAAGAMGFLFALAGVSLFAGSVAGITFPYYIQWTIDRRVGAFLAAVCVGTALLVGVAPALYAARRKTAMSGARGRRLTAALLTVELTLTLVLLASAGLMLRSFAAVYRADAVVDATRVVAMSVSLPDEKYPTVEQRVATYGRLEERIGGIPGVTSTAFASVIPFAGGPSRQLSVEGPPRSPGETQPMVSYVTIRGRYFEALGLRMLRGRTFVERDAMNGSEGAIVNQRLAEMFFGGRDPVGERICLTVPNAAAAPPAACATIVGLSPTVRQQYFQDIDPVVYLPDRGDAAVLMLLVRADTTPGALTPAIRAGIATVDDGISLNAVMSLDDAMTQSRWGHRVFGGMLTVFAGAALLLAAVGLYAVTAFSVVQRTREIGVRVALGARSGAVVWLFVKRVALPLGVATCVGLGGAWVAGRLLRRFLIQTSPTDPAVLVGVVALVSAVSFAAAFFPARRAAHVDPVAALRCE